MIKSMTGFGKGESVGKFGRFAVEIRAVNHRYFDVSSRVPNSLGQLEDKIKNCLHQYIKRGKVNLALSHRRGEKDDRAAKIDEKAAVRYYRMLKTLKSRFKLQDDIKLSHLLFFPDVIAQDQPEHDANAMWPVIEKAVKAAALDCNKMREKEGRALYKDISGRMRTISDSIDEICTMIPGLVLDYKRKLEEKILELLEGKSYVIDKQRLETELAIFAKQSDVSEELTRAKSHLVALKETLLLTTEAGRRLDFILQELQREINTLGSKISGIKVSRSVVDIKSEIEKIREQAQNIE